MEKTEKSNALLPALTVLYDGSCPLCRREIGIYQGLPSSEPLAWKDVSAAGAALPGDTRREDLMVRFHVMQADGAVLSGAKAFVALWSTLPGWRWLSRLARLPGATPCLEWLYCRFLVARPGLHRRARAFEKEAGGNLR